jgi:hypothetical protein
MATGMSNARRLGIVAGVLATVVLGPSAVVASALDEANRAPMHHRPWRPATAVVASELPRTGLVAGARNRAVPA